MKKILFLLATCAYAQYPLQDAPYQVIYTANGIAVPCQGCYLYTYNAGTTTPLATYTSSTLGVTLPNPVRTNSAGYAVSGSGAITGIWVAAAACYHLVFKNAAAVTVFDQDHVCTPAAGPGAGTLTGVTAKCGLRAGGTATVPALSVDGPCWAAGGGTAQAQTATYTPATTLTLVDGLFLCWKPTAANTGAAPTFAPNGLTAHTIVKAGGALVANDIITTAQACAIYNSTGTQWELQNPQVSSGAASVLHTFTFNVTATGQTAAVIAGNYSCTIVGWSINGTPSGTVSADIDAVANSAFPAVPSIPNTTSDKISASAPIATSSALAASGGATEISTWTTAITPYMAITANVTTFTTTTFSVITVYCQQ